MKDQQSIDALDFAWRHSEGQVTDQELAAAWDAAWDAWDAAWDAAGAAQAKKLKQILDLGYWVD